MTPYLTIERAAAIVGVSPRTVHRLAQKDAIPHRRLPGMRRLLFSPADLAAWTDGAPLERVDLPGGRIVRPVTEGGES